MTAGIRPAYRVQRAYDRLTTYGTSLGALVEDYVRRDIGLHVHLRWCGKLAEHHHESCAFLYWAGELADADALDVQVLDPSTGADRHRASEMNEAVLIDGPHVIEHVQRPQQRVLPSVIWLTSLNRGLCSPRHATHLPTWATTTGRPEINATLREGKGRGSCQRARKRMRVSGLQEIGKVLKGASEIVNAIADQERDGGIDGLHVPEPSDGPTFVVKLRREFIEARLAKTLHGVLDVF